MYKGCNVVVKQRHIAWIDTMRVFTLLLVIIGHSEYYSIVTAYGGIEHPAENGIGAVSTIINGIVRFIYSFHMPLFIAISGACLALGYNRITDRRTFLKKKARLLLIPFVLVTILYMLPMRYIAGWFDTSENVVKDMFFGQILLYGNTHLWFVVALFWCFLAFVIFESLITHFPKVLVGGVLIISTLASDVVFVDFPEILGLGDFAKLFFYFVLGFYIVENVDRWKISWKLLVISIVANVLFFFRRIDFVEYTPWATFVGGMMNRLYGVALALWGCYNATMLCKKITSAIPQLLQTTPFKYLKTNSYGLYLYSDPVNYLFITLFFSFEEFDVYMNPVHSILAFVIRIVGTLLAAMIVIKFLEWLHTLRFFKLKYHSS